MFRTVNDQPTLWDAILPPEVLVLPVELGRLDALLDDPVFFTPSAAYFDARIGRPSIPMETYLRLMFLKSRYRLGFGSLCREVSDSISWQRFRRIPFGEVCECMSTRTSLPENSSGIWVAAANAPGEDLCGALSGGAVHPRPCDTPTPRGESPVLCDRLTDQGQLPAAGPINCFLGLVSSVFKEYIE